VIIRSGLLNFNPKIR